MNYFNSNQLNRFNIISKLSKFDIPIRLILSSILISLLFFSFSYSRHLLFQSNYDLLLFDQWIWLISQGLEPISSITSWHVISDHAAWMLYIFAPLYKIVSTVNWLFITQAISLSFTGIPLWLLAKNNNLSTRNCWFICLVWWLQPVVFNVNIADFHPEVWAMPILAMSYLFARKNQFSLWFLSLILILGCRDGLLIIVFGIFIENLIRKRWKYALASFILSCGWFFLIKYIIFPHFKNIGSGLAGASESNIANYSSFIINPLQQFLEINYLIGLEYILLISISFIPLWNKRSLITIVSGIPLIVINFISTNPSFKMLIHQYNLPLALIGTISIIDALSISPRKNISWKKLTWLSICWFALAKPYFFTGPYLARVNNLSILNDAINNIPKEASVLTTSYIAPHLSHREKINFPRLSISSTNLNNYTAVLLNPSDPGWGSNEVVQKSVIKKAKNTNWKCKDYYSGLTLCLK
tara:strand:- start:329 stop:1738 length:1410 start_codon:yes stop_codon:yes gene_type:complete